jgi:hypothetical protein
MYIICFIGPVYGLAPRIFPTCGTAQKQRGAVAEVAVGELTLARCARRDKQSLFL